MSEDILALKDISRYEDEISSLKKELASTPITSYRYQIIMNRIMLLSYTVEELKWVWCW